MTFLDTLGSAATLTGTQSLILLGPLAILVVLLNLTSKAVLRLALSFLSPRLFLYLFGWLGTIVHELSHALFCLIFGHRIAAIKLFDPDSSDGSLGYVRHEYNPRNPYHQIGNLFIGIGPILVGAAFLSVGALLLLGGGKFPEIAANQAWFPGGTTSNEIASIAGPVLNDLQALGSLLFDNEHLSRPLAAVFFYVAFSVGSLMSMSWEDMAGAVPGLVAVVLLLFIGNLLSLIAGWTQLTEFAWGASSAMGLGYSMMAVAVIVNVTVAFLLFLLYLPNRLFGG